MKKEDKREYLGNNGDVVKIVGIVQHLGEIRGIQTICLASIKIYKNDGTVEKCDHTWIQNPTNLKLKHDFIGKIIRLEGEVHEYIKFNRRIGSPEIKKGITMLNIIK